MICLGFIISVSDHMGHEPRLLTTETFTLKQTVEMNNNLNHVVVSRSYYP